MSSESNLNPSLGPFTIWGLGVGYVISGMYFGWNLGLVQGGPYGLLAATLVVTLMYVTFVASYAELACAMPKAGGAFFYATQAFGPSAGFVVGVAQIIEFALAPPAIAAAIGAYFSLYVPSLPPLTTSITAYVIFTALNIYGVRQSAMFELIITVFAVGELLIFAGVTAPSFQFENFSQDPLPKGWLGAFRAIPYAIWFYLAIEGIANIAEESKNPQRDISRGFLFAMATLVVLALLVFFSAVGVAGWKAVVYAEGSTTPSDSPLPLALARVVGDSSIFYHLLISIGLFGLIASFHGIILASGRALFEFGRSGFIHASLGKTLRERKTPAAALLLNLCIGIAALLTGKTGDLITLSVFGALTLYAFSMLALFRLRQKQPDLLRPFLAPRYPVTPLIALILSIGCLISMCVAYFQLFAIYVLILGIAIGYYRLAIFVEHPQCQTK